MFVFSFKASTLKYLGVMSLCTLAIVITVAMIPSNDLSEGVGGEAVPVSSQRKPGDFKNVKSNTDRVQLLQSYGWEVGEEPVCSMEVTIPEKFDSVYSSYNGIQKKVGLDLEKYKGKTAMFYTYIVKNADGDAYANLLVYKNKVIGGDITSVDPEGFAYSLDGK